MRHPLPRATRPLLLLSSLLLSACGGGGGGGTGGGAATGDVGNYLPMAVGNRWLYQQDEAVDLGVVEHNANLEKISGTTLVAGQEALLRHFAWLAPNRGMYFELSQAKTPTGLVSVLDPATSPGGLSQMLLLRLPLAAGDSYIARDYTGLVSTTESDGDGQPEHIDFRATVDVLGVESVTVPAGTFTAMKVRTQTLYRVNYSADGSSHTVTATATDWYAPGVGRVRNTSDNVGTSLPAGTSSTYSTTNELAAWKVDGVSSDTTAPTVVSHLPAADASVASDTEIFVTFSEHMDPVTLMLLLGGDGPWFTLEDASHQPVPVTDERYSDKTLTITPQVPLSAGTYTATLAGATDAMGNALAPVSWSFTVN